MTRSTFVSLVVVRTVVLFLLVASCAQDLPKVSRGTPGADYNRGAMLKAIETFVEDGRTALAYRDLARAFAALQDGFDEDVAKEAERNLVFLALAPLEEVLERPAEGQMFELASTVWPVVLGVEPKEGQSPREYVDQICKEELAAVCRRVVETYRPAFVLAEVWTRFRDRARESLAECLVCDETTGYPQALARFEVIATQLTVSRTSLREAASPTRWPDARAHGTPWKDRPLLTVDHQGIASIAGTSLAPEEWASALKAARDGGTELGLFLGPTERLSTVRAIVREAARAGFETVAFQARQTDYPFALAEYRVRIAGRGPTLRVREVDTVQVLLHLLDDFASRDEIPSLGWIS